VKAVLALAVNAVVSQQLRKIVVIVAHNANVMKTANAIRAEIG
jgi:hypothetical protein